MYISELQPGDILVNPTGREYVYPVLLGRGRTTVWSWFDYQ